MARHGELSGVKNGRVGSMQVGGKVRRRDRTWFVHGERERWPVGTWGCLDMEDGRRDVSKGKKDIRPKNGVVRVKGGAAGSRTSGT